LKGETYTDGDKPVVYGGKKVCLQNWKRDRSKYLGLGNLLAGSRVSAVSWGEENKRTEGGGCPNLEKRNYQLRGSGLVF